MWRSYHRSILHPPYIVGFHFNYNGDIYFSKDIFQQNIGRAAPPFPGSPLSKGPATPSQNPIRTPGKKRGPKPKDGVGVLGLPVTKKKSQKSLLKAEAGELDLLEIHTKHTLKKFNPGKSKKNKVWDCLHLLFFF